MKLEYLVACNMADLRHRRGWTQSDLAHRMRPLGANWTSNRVAQLETLRGRISFFEVYALAVVLEVPLVVLLAGDHAVTRPDNVGSVPLAAIRKALARTDYELPPERQPVALALPSVVAGVQDDIEEIRKIAKRVGVPPPVLDYLARRTWGHPFTVERDARTGDVSTLSTRSAQTKRGHTTRALIREMKARIEGDALAAVLAGYQGEQDRKRKEMLARLLEGVA